MIRIILDTNFLLVPAQLKLDIFAEFERIMEEPYKLFVLEETLEELRKIRGKDAPAAKVGLALVQAKDLNIITNLREKTVDDELLLLSREGYRIATQDAALRRRVGKGVFIVRQRKRIVVQ
jgi:uncharacterized protein